MDRRFSNGAGRVALCGVLAALACVVLYGASVAPTGGLGLVAAAGVFPAAALVTGGWQASVLCYVSSGLLALLVAPSKVGALAYLAFFGLYPLVKSPLEQIRVRPLSWLCKLVWGNGALAAGWFFFRALALAQLPPMFEHLWVFWVAGNGAFVLYDLALSQVISFYLRRIHRAVFKS